MGSDIYRTCIRPLLFSFDAERVHELSIRACEVVARCPLLLQVLERSFGHEDERLRVSAAGLAFPNPIGLGAGFDKNGRGVQALGALQFGFIEVGSVSADPSAGNQARPRLLRLPADDALLVFYGVPNDGAEAVSRRLAKAPRAMPVGVSLVETNTGFVRPVERVVEEMVAAARAFVGVASYLTLNLSCPNTNDGRSHFDEARNLRMLLESLNDVRALPPVFLKVRTTPEAEAIERVLEVCDAFNFVKGFIPSAHAAEVRTKLKTPKEVFNRVPGSVTGPINRHAANHAVRSWYARIDRARHVIVGVGGVVCAEDAYDSIKNGASLVQLVTGLVYRGPGLVRQIKRGLCELMERDGFERISDVVGTGHWMRA